MPEDDLELDPCPATVPGHPELSCDWPKDHYGPHRIVIEWDGESDPEPVEALDG